MLIRDYGEIGPLLKSRRLSMNLTQTQLGDRIGVSQERISKMESHPERITINNFLTLLMVLKLHLDITELPSANGASHPLKGHQVNNNEEVHEKDGPKKSKVDW